MSINIGYAGDRDISVEILNFVHEKGIRPKSLFLPTEEKATHDNKLLKLCDHLEESVIFRGNEFKNNKSIEILNDLNLDYILSIHFPYIYTKEVLNIPEYGVLNLHPAYLPFNKGWHTPTWAIYDGTPYGATLHYMEEELDSGPIVHQKELEVRPDDTANSLYQRVKKLEVDIFKECWNDLISFNISTKPQIPEAGTKHLKIDIKKIQEVKLDENIKTNDLIKKMRALTTNKISEAAYFEKDGKKYRMQIHIKKDRFK